MRQVADITHMKDMEPMIIMQNKAGMGNLKHKLIGRLEFFMKNDLEPCKQCLDDFHLSYGNSFLKLRADEGQSYDIRKIFQNAFTLFLQDIPAGIMDQHQDEIIARLESSLQKAYRKHWLFFGEQCNSRILIDGHKVLPNNTFDHWTDLELMFRSISDSFMAGVVVKAG